MAVAYEELAGSPKLTFDRKGGGGQRRFKIAWDQIAAFNAELFPRPSSGYGGVASIPGAPWLVCQKANYSPFSEGGEAAPDDDTDGPINSYTNAGCLVEADYGVFHDDQQQGTPPAGSGGAGSPDGSGPGGKNGSSAGQPVEYLRHEIHIGGEFLTIPSKAIRRRKDQKKASSEIHAGMVVPQIDHRVGLPHVRTPPWVDIRTTVGRINLDDYAEALAGHIMFMGCDAVWSRGRDGVGEWDLTYLFSEKIRDWNEFLDTDGRGENFERYEYNDGSDIFKSAPFPALFANLNQV